ncbi:MAG: four helix bundle protein [Candidatus Hydrogenedentes bacterium]|nr:four helix bundle protein [Candidatus Hydrogenedentota bacterium]
MSLARQCYKVTESFPKSEAFGISLQIRRAAVSIPCNIAEGWGREGAKEFSQFLRIAQGSTKELETLLLLAQDLYPQHAVKAPELLAILAEISRMLRALMAKLSTKPR